MLPGGEARGQPRGIAGTLYGGSATLLIIQGAGAALSFGLHALLVRISGAEQYGHFAYALNWLAILLLLGHLGLNTASLRFVPAYHAHNDWPRLRGFLRLTRRAVLMASVAVGAATASLLALAAEGLDRDFAGALSTLALGLAPIALLTVWGTQLRALQRVAASQLPLSILFPLAAGAIALGMSRSETRAADLALLYVISMGIAAAVSGTLLLRATPLPARSSTSVYERGEWRQVTSRMLGIALLQVLQLRLATTILGLVAPAEEVARYAVALRLSTLVSFGFVAVSAWASPLIAQRESVGDREGMARISRLGARATLAFALVVTAILAVWGDWLLALFDPGFTDTFVSLMILAIAECLTCFTGTAASLLIMTGHEWVARRIEAAVAVVLILAAAVLVPAYGILGAAGATLATSIFRNTTLAVLVWRRLGIRCGPL